MQTEFARTRKNLDLRPEYFPSQCFGADLSDVRLPAMKQNQLSQDH